MQEYAFDRFRPRREFTIMFIGGKHDGEVRLVKKLPPIVHLRKEEENPSLEPSPEEKESYRKHELSVGEVWQKADTAAILYIHTGLTLVQAMNMILTRYVQGK